MFYSELLLTKTGAQDVFSEVTILLTLSIRPSRESLASLQPRSQTHKVERFTVKPGGQCQEHHWRRTGAYRAAAQWPAFAGSRQDLQPQSQVPYG